MAAKEFSDIPYLAVGAVVAAQEELMRAADILVEKGKSLTPEGRRKMASGKRGLVSKGDDFSMVVGRTIQRVLENAGIVTKEDLDVIGRRVDTLEEKLEAPASKKKAAAKEKTAGKKKSAAKKKAAGKKAAAGKKKPAVKKAAAGKAQSPGKTPGGP